ncbi:hypothetical protein B0H19DRAFT_1200910 [Mycena capillaripes]|nr:hypothetical protein B0H19DRAFT_1200910 [Mycena capillaripes]
MDGYEHISSASRDSDLLDVRRAAALSLPPKPPSCSAVQRHAWLDRRALLCTAPYSFATHSDLGIALDPQLRIFKNCCSRTSRRRESCTVRAFWASINAATARPSQSPRHACRSFPPLCVRRRDHRYMHGQMYPKLAQRLATVATGTYTTTYLDMVTRAALKKSRQGQHRVQAPVILPTHCHLHDSASTPTSAFHTARPRGQSLSRQWACCPPVETFIRSAAELSTLCDSCLSTRVSHSEVSKCVQFHPSRLCQDYNDGGRRLLPRRSRRRRRFSQALFRLSLRQSRVHQSFFPAGHPSLCGPFSFGMTSTSQGHFLAILLRRLQVPAARINLRPHVQLSLLSAVFRRHRA